MRCWRESCVITGRWGAMAASPALRTKAVAGGASRDWPRPATAGVRRGMLNWAGRGLIPKRNGACTNGYGERPANGRGDTRKTMIVALARKLLIALWRYVTTGELPAGVVLKAKAI